MPGKKRADLRTGQPSRYRYEPTNADLAARELAAGGVPDAGEAVKRETSSTARLREQAAQRRAELRNSRREARISRARAATARVERDQSVRRTSSATTPADADRAYAALFEQARGGQITDARRVRCPTCREWVTAKEALRHRCPERFLGQR